MACCGLPVLWGCCWLGGVVFACPLLKDVAVGFPDVYLFLEKTGENRVSPVECSQMVVMLRLACWLPAVGCSCTAATACFVMSWRLAR